MATAAAAVESHWITVAQRAPGSTERERERRKERKGPQQAANTVASGAGEMRIDI